MSPKLPKWRLNRKQNEFDKSFEVNQTYPKLFNRKTSKQRLDFARQESNDSNISNDTIHHHHDLSSFSYYQDFEQDDDFKDFNPYAAILILPKCDEPDSVIERGNFLVSHYTAYSHAEIQRMTLSELIYEKFEDDIVDILTKNGTKMKMKLEKVEKAEKLFVILQPIILKEAVVLVSNTDFTIQSYEANKEADSLFEGLDELLGQPLDSILPEIDVENLLRSKVSTF